MRGFKRPLPMKVLEKNPGQRPRTPHSQLRIPSPPPRKPRSTGFVVSSDPRRPCVDSPPEQFPGACKVVHVARARTDEQVDRSCGLVGPWLSLGVSDGVALTHRYEDWNPHGGSLGSHYPGSETRRPDGARHGRRSPWGKFTEARWKALEVGPNDLRIDVVVEEAPAHVPPRRGNQRGENPGRAWGLIPGTGTIPRGKRFLVHSLLDKVWLAAI
jgi:hypothetical protein